jgi:hypothetical protein
MLEVFFEAKPNVEVEHSITHALDTLTLAEAREMASDKFDYLASQGAITFTEAEMGKQYIPYADLKDLLSFKMGIRGFLSESINDHRH